MQRGLRRLSGEALRFSAVNVVATVVSLIIFNALVHGIKGVFDGPLHERPLTTYLLANTIGMFVSYYGASRFAFANRTASGPGGGIVRYIAINLLSFVIPISCLWVTRNVFGFDGAFSDNISGNVVGAVLGTIFRFWAFRAFVFQRNTAPQARTIPRR